MKSYVNEEVKKINEKVYDRRLVVQAVIAQRAKLVGTKTAKRQILEHNMVLQLFLSIEKVNKYSSIQKKSS